MDLNQFLPIPRLDEAQNLLCIMPHPDDNEIGAGGTIARLAAKGARVTYLGVTDGRVGTDDPNMKPDDLAAIRREEQMAAARILGVHAVEWLNYPDGAGLPEHELREKIMGVIRRVKPDFILTVDPWLAYEAHPDHRITGLAATGAMAFAKHPHICPEQIRDGLAPHAVTAVAFYGTSAPNTYVDIESTWQKKLAAIAAHESQFNEQSLQVLTFYLDLKSVELAAVSGKGYTRAEGFKVLTPTHLHMNVDTVVSC